MPFSTPNFTDPSGMELQDIAESFDLTATPELVVDNYRNDTAGLRSRVKSRRVDQNAGESIAMHREHSLGTGILTSPQPLAEKSNYALETNFGNSLVNDDSSSNEPVPYLPEEDLDADSFFSEFADSLLDDLFAIA